MTSINLNQKDKNVSSTSNIVENDDGFMKIEEGTANMLYDKNEPVFYNKVQVLNRDLR
jgi:tRNA G26 N,N-dimethylase Trm1